ncbi:MAG TPA: ATP-binding protein [Candidatus Polarisedimenticolaceae bacterium]|nr:ATP-binding protein [Candidatus Polarisedimenticolaceae bacterium]
MRAPRLAASVSLALAALAGLGVLGTAASGIHVLRRLAADQARARVRAGAAAAVESARVAGDALAAGARVLAERPMLARLLQGGDPAELRAYLARYAAAWGLDGCAVLRGETVLARTGDLPSPETMPPGDAWTVGRDGAGLVLVACRALPAGEGVRAVTVRRMDPRFAATLARSVGLAVRVLAPDASPPTQERSSTAYLASWPLRVEGRVAALLQAELPRTEVEGPLRARVRGLALWAALVCLLAVGAGVLLGRRVARPIEGLTLSADRIGRGDLVTPVPRAGGREIGTLAETMEEMRARLMTLTAELRRRGEEVEAVLGGIVEGVFTVDADRRIHFLTPQAAALLGTTPEEAIGRFCGDVLRPLEERAGRPCERDCPILQARFRGSVRRVEHLTTPAGRRTVVITSASPGEEGRQVQLIRDETETEAVRRLRDGVLANLSHEFKTPLSAQLASLELLRERLGHDVPEDAEELLSALERGTLRLTRLVDNLLESVRLEAGVAAIRRSPVQLDEVIEDAVESTTPLLRQRGQSIEVELPWPLPPLVGDATRLTQVFVNLLANANKYAPEGSTVRVGGSVRDGHALLWVEDDGPGLPPQATRNLFERFVRGRSAAGDEPEAGGMGLGLWIARSIVERHGGTLQPQGEGPGTRMCVVLPLAGDGA